MAVIRISKTKGFTVMSNYHLRDKNLSLKAKGLLSLMLSLPDGWHYTVRGLSSICKEGVDSISSGIRELDKCGYVRRHQANINGKFQEIEYIIYETPQQNALDFAEEDSDFSSAPNTSAMNDPTPVAKDGNSSFSGQAYMEIPHTEKPDTENPYAENPYSKNPYTESPHTVNSHTVTPCTEKPDALLNTKRKKTEKIKTDKYNYPSINQRGADAPVSDPIDAMDASQKKFLEQLGAKQAADEFEQYRKIVKDNIEFDSLCLRHQFDRATLEGMVELIVEVVCSKEAYIRIAGQDFPHEVVKSRLLKLHSSHIDYVLTCMSKNTVKVNNMKAYLLTALFNSVTTIDPYYQNWVLSDNPQFAKP